ncbi:MAG: GNAT family N-acetyltransferase [Sphingobacteriales bacterium]|nr:GNAT family N-acetyltransferase [Sphingobacteriales bacterium]
MISWVLKKFGELSVHELYAILQLRNEVFAIEQNCVYPDMDNRDQPSHHLMGWPEGLLKEQNKKLIAYSRIIPPGIVYPEPSIGRVVTSASVRRTGIGKELMEKSILETYKLYGKTPVKIGAQLYLQKFYSSLGFIQTSDIYLEDGIEHIEMLKP